MSENHPSLIKTLGIAGFVSLCSLFFSWIGVVLLLTQQVPFALMSAVLAFFCDCLDGLIARKLKTESAFGRYLDSMIDFFNYSVFSALLFFLYLSHNVLGAAIAGLILATGVLRLVRFTVDGYHVENQSLYYEGLVVCHISFLTAALFFTKQLIPSFPIFTIDLIIVIASFLQLSRIKIKKTNMYPLWLGMGIGIFLLAVWFQVWKK